MYTKEFEIRWSDVDANRHLRNSAYVDYMSQTRMGCFTEQGLGDAAIVANNLAPVALYEHIYYFREVFSGTPVTVSLEMKGLAPDGRFFEFVHNFYDDQGRNLARSIMLGGWIDMTTRKLKGLPPELYAVLEGLPRTEDFEVLTKENVRKFHQRPKNL